MKVTKYIAALALIMGLVACQPAEVFNAKGSVQDADSVAVVSILSANVELSKILFTLLITERLSV